MAVSTGVNELLVNEVLAIYLNAEQAMLQKLAKNSSNWANTKTGNVQRVRKELEAALESIHKKAIPKSTKAIISSYLKGTNSVNVDLKLPKTAIKNMDIPFHIQRLVMETNEIIKGSSFRILRDTMDEYRKVISGEAGVLLTGAVTRIEATQQALNQFAAKGITGFVDKAGRRWEMASYAEMAVRTASSRAALQGHVDRSQEIDHDLMIVSHFGKTCPICAPWEGKVLSISGKDPAYPSLSMAKSAGLFHPHCKHTLLAYFPGITDVPERTPNNLEAYNAMQRQRYNERQIRKYKRLDAVAITPKAKSDAMAKIAMWQSIQREHVEKFGLRRKYYRETIRGRTGDALKARPENSNQPSQQKPSSEPAKKQKQIRKNPIPVNDPKESKKEEPAKKKKQSADDKWTMPDGLLKNGMTAEHKKKLEDRVNLMPKEVRALWLKHSKEFKIIQNADGDYYLPSDATIRLSTNGLGFDQRGSYNTFFHELGHLIDYAEGKSNPYKRQPSMRNEFINAMKKDYEAKLDQLGKERIQSTLFFGPDYTNGVQDVFRGLSDGKIRTKYGHSTDYYKRESRGIIEARELWAHMYSASTMQVKQEIMKEWFPNSWKAFLKICRETSKAEPIKI